MSSICAVLAETDVINMVSRGIAIPDILKGIYISMASRLVELLKVTSITKGTVLLTGGLALDEGREPPRLHYAGAIGAALWGALRHARLKELQERVAA